MSSKPVSEFCSDRHARLVVLQRAQLLSGQFDALLFPVRRPTPSSWSPPDTLVLHTARQLKQNSTHSRPTCARTRKPASTGRRRPVLCGTSARRRQFKTGTVYARRWGTMSCIIWVSPSASSSSPRALCLTGHSAAARTTAHTMRTPSPSTSGASHSMRCSPPVS
jgi:hypothetical protein